LQYEMGPITVSEKATAGVRAPLVTIVIVNHNYDGFVEQCIRSVDQQDYPHIQCIVLECASTDNSLLIIEKTLSQTVNGFFELVRRDVNEGHLTNALSVLTDIKGDFVTYLDADDFLFPEFVSTHIKAHLNDLCSASVSVTDQVQVDAGGRILAGTCHWHQKWRMSEPGTAWTELTHARSWSSNSPYRMAKLDIPRLHYVPAWWSSWLAERWIWSTTSGLMLRKSAIETVAPTMEASAALRTDVGFDGYFARIAHSVGGTLVVDGAEGAYRRHGRNKWSRNQLLGGQTPNGSHDETERFRNTQQAARQILVTRYQDLVRKLGRELYYSVAWQLMSNQEFLDFAKGHGADRDIWQKTIESAGPPRP
jgi:glycosyltransferase involved in cell wall biosynthesis